MTDPTDSRSVLLVDVLLKKGKPAKRMIQHVEQLLPRSVIALVPASRPHRVELLLHLTLDLFRSVHERNGTPPCCHPRPLHTGRTRP